MQIIIHAVSLPCFWRIYLSIYKLSLIRNYPKIEVQVCTKRIDSYAGFEMLAIMYLLAFKWV